MRVRHAQVACMLNECVINIMYFWQKPLEVRKYITRKVREKHSI